MEFETDRSKTCTFIGHRTIEKTDALAEKVTSEIRRLITEEGYDTFLLGSKSLFNDLCMDILSELKKEYPHIRRIYVRAEYPVIKDDYKEFCLILMVYIFQIFLHFLLLKFDLLIQQIFLLCQSAELLFDLLQDNNLLNYVL